MKTVVNAAPPPHILHIDWLDPPAGSTYPGPGPGPGHGHGHGHGHAQAGRPGGPLLDTPGQVALSSCPGRPDLGGTVRDDVADLVRYGIRVVVTLVEDREMEYYGAFGLRAAVREAGLRSIYFPLVDTQPPDDLFATRSLCGQILAWLGEGEHTLIHCIGGWGRSGTITASLLTHHGYDPVTATQLVRRARHPRCVDSRAQEQFVHAYAAVQRDYQRFYVKAGRAELTELLTGTAGARRLRRQLVPASALKTAAELRTQPSAASADLVLLSGELPASAEHGFERGAADLVIDRVYVPHGQHWRTVRFADLADFAKFDR